ncbi:hypothetical protein ARMSODRAFT_163426 [Armillaria solidipes]|uniref:Uncharacterized protein n=1 Tax=Armillaria solidipes TaxID=1076256 RepID=A0A2H3BEZ4_9AGAR|nr:hypothetical protein ARMSODRAFT_163426 [Armillaria solidipes]
MLNLNFGGLLAGLARPDKFVLMLYRMLIRKLSAIRKEVGAKVVTPSRYTRAVKSSIKSGTLVIGSRPVLSADRSRASSFNGDELRHSSKPTTARRKVVSNCICFCLLPRCAGFWTRCYVEKFCNTAMAWHGRSYSKVFWNRFGSRGPGFCRVGISIVQESHMSTIASA